MQCIQVNWTSKHARPYRLQAPRLVLDHPVQLLGDELLNREIFTTLEEAKVLTEVWRREYNQVRPHSALGYKPPAPEAVSGPLSATAS